MAPPPGEAAAPPTRATRRRPRRLIARPRRAPPATTPPPLPSGEPARTPGRTSSRRRRNRQRWCGWSTLSSSTHRWTRHARVEALHLLEACQLGAHPTRRARGGRPNSAPLEEGDQQGHELLVLVLLGDAHRRAVGRLRRVRARVDQRLRHLHPPVAARRDQRRLLAAALARTAVGRTPHWMRTATARWLPLRQASRRRPYAPSAPSSSAHRLLRVLLQDQPQARHQASSLRSGRGGAAGSRGWVTSTRASTRRRTP